MLRPERMSKVSVTGAKPVMDDVIETVHELNLLHLSDYDGSWEGFGHGDPDEGAEAASEKLVTVRSLESILDVSAEDAGPSRIVTDEALDEELEEVRQEANELDDRRDELEGELREVEERIDTMAPFAALGIELDLLSGYDSLDVAVGEGDAEAVEAALAGADAVQAFETFTADDAVAVFAYPAGEDTDVLDDVLVGVEFQQLAVPDAEGAPSEYLEELRHRKQQLESKLNTVENELEELRLDAAGFLLAAEEQLSIEVQKTEAPLQFATTDNAFVAEGWVPTDRYDDLVAGLESAVGDRVEVEELERASYEEGHPEHVESVGGAAGAEGGEAVADGGTTMGDSPPVVQENPGAIKPFELLVETINRPKYTEFDPTVILFLTFPAFFGFMIGDLGYGILYMGIGALLLTRFDNDAITSLGGIALWAGGFTAVFGILYGELFGLHKLGEWVWNGHPPIHKGLQPKYGSYALTWLSISVLAGVGHLTIGYVFGFLKDLSHGVKEAVLEDGSWLLMLFGFWVWIFSEHVSGPKPDFMVGEASVFNTVDPVNIGFTGFSTAVGQAALGVFVVGLIMIFIADKIEFVEALFLQVFVNGLSYTRIAAVLLAKAGMAFVVNLLFFGVGVEHTGEPNEEWHFLITESPAQFMKHHPESGSIMFDGLLHTGGIAGVIGGLVVLVLGHLLVLALGITSAGLQAVRLEYVEFFNKFYDGGGAKYEPFGYERQYTTED